MVSVVFTYVTCHSSQRTHGFPYIAIYLEPRDFNKTALITSGTSVSFYKEITMKFFTIAIRNFV